jgi:hypothetical protein
MILWPSARVIRVELVIDIREGTDRLGNQAKFVPRGTNPFARLQTSRYPWLSLHAY